MRIALTLALVFGLANLAQAAISIGSAYNQASTSGSFYYNNYNDYFTTYNDSPYNYDVNGSAESHPSWNGQPYWPYLASDARGGNGTDYSSSITTYGEAKNHIDANSWYGNYASASSSGSSTVWFTLTEKSIATLYLYTFAYTNVPDYFDYNSASATAGLYNTATGEWIAYQEQSSSYGYGTGNFDSSSTTTVVLEAGEYALSYSNATAYGGSYNYYGGVNDQWAYGQASLFNVTPVPEPAMLTIWGIGAVGCALAVYKRRKAIQTS